jgi:thiol-disulfide isomerase/thioredoxin
MIKNILLFTLLAFGGLTTQAQYRFQGEVKGVKDTTCILAYYYGDKQYAKDTAEINSQGQFVFEGEETLGGGIYMVIFPEEKYMEMIVSEQSFSFQTDIQDLVGKMSFQNSKENDAFYGYMQYLSTQREKLGSLQAQIAQSSGSQKANLEATLEALNKEVTSYQDNFVANNADVFFSKVLKANQEIVIPEPPTLPNGKQDSLFQFKYYKKHFFDNFDFTDNRMIRTPILHGKIKTYLENLTVKQADSIIVSCDYLVNQARADKELFKYVVSYLTSHYERSKIMGLEKVFVHMVNTYYKTGEADWVNETQLFKITDRAETIAPLVVGELAPNLYLRDTAEVVRQLHQIEADFTMIIFYDPDCGHCKKEMPSIKEHYEKWRKEGIKIEVYAVSVELEKQKWLDFIKEFEIQEWINVGEFRTIVDGEYVRENDLYVTPQPYIKQLYDISGTPKTYLLDKDKKILVNAIKGNVSIEQIGELMKRELEKR